MSRTEKALGTYAGFFRDRRQATRWRNVRLAEIVAPLQVMDIDVGAFFLRACGSEPSAALSMPPVGKVPTLVQKARARFASTTPGTAGRAALEAACEARWEAPDETLAALEALLPTLESQLVPRFLATVGHCYRLTFALEAAEQAFFVGRELARHQGDEAVNSMLLARSAYVASDRGSWAQALALAVEATTIGLRRGEQDVVACGLVDQGIFLYHLDRHDEAIDTQKTALSSLPQDRDRHRAAALQVLALCHQKAGDLAEAVQFAKEARGALRRQTAFDRGRFLWVEGTIACSHGELRCAKACFTQARDALEHPADVALLTTELIHVLLASGRVEAAYAEARSLIELVEPLGEDRIVSAAILELIRCCLAGEGLTSTLAQQVRDTILKERRRHFGRLR